jgi:hypothetical protein
MSQTVSQRLASPSGKIGVFHGMLGFFKLLVTAIACILGAASLYAAIFLYEDEEKNIQNKLEVWWLKMDDSRVHYSSVASRFIRSVAGLTNGLLDALFGRRFVSLQALLVSACISIASTCVFLTCIEASFTVLFNLADRIPLPHLVAVRSCVLVVIITVAIVPMLVRSSRIRSFLSLLLLILIIAVLPLVPQHIAGWAHTFYPRLPVEDGGDYQRQFALEADYVITFVTLVIALASGTVFLILTRYLLRWVASSTHALLAITVLIINCLLSAAMVYIPPSVLGKYHDPIFDPVQPAGLDIGGSNLGNAMATCVFFGIGLLFGLHHLFWPAISRATYAWQSIGIARRRKLFSSVGFCLLSYSGISLPASLKEVVQLLAGR